MFAISHVRIATAADLPFVLQAWQSAALHNLGQSLPDESIALGQWYALQGQDTQQRSIAAQLMWRQEGLDLYHWAVYGEAIGPQHLEPMFLAYH
jgi:hypothetical protein